MPTMIGKGVIAGLSGATFTCTLSGYVSPRLDSVGATHDAEAVALKDQEGKTIGWLWNGDEGLSMDIDFTPQGTSVANAKLAGGLPLPLSTITIAGMPSIAVGGFSDALNGALWTYLGGGKITIPADANTPATSTLRIVKRVNITSMTLIA